MEHVSGKFSDAENLEPRYFIPFKTVQMFNSVFTAENLLDFGLKK
jgi:hypothetical protein